MFFYFNFPCYRNTCPSAHPLGFPQELRVSRNCLTSSFQVDYFLKMVMSRDVLTIQIPMTPVQIYQISENVARNFIVSNPGNFVAVHP